MPHKHKRKHHHDAECGAEEEFDLPPSARARPLPALKPRAAPWEGVDGVGKRSNKRRKPGREGGGGGGGGGAVVKDDTPKNFVRLMAWRKEKRRGGLDDGAGGNSNEKEGKKKKRKREEEEKAKDMGKARASITNTTTGDTAPQTDRIPPSSEKKVGEAATSMQPVTGDDSGSSSSAAAAANLKIRPGERLQDFALRVDQTLPLSHVPKHSTKETAPGLKTKLTRHNRHLQRMQTEWRNAEAKRVARRDEEDEDVLDRREEEGLLWMDVEAANGDRKGKRRRKGGMEDGDPWSVLEKKRREGGGGGGGGAGGGLRASDMVQAPPVLKLVKNMFREPHERRVVGVRS